MSFCGSRQGSLSVKEGVLKNKCFVDVMNIVPHGILLVVSTLILIAWRESIMGQMKAKIWIHFHCHSIRYILTIILVLVCGLELAEGLVSDYLDPDSMNYHVIVPPCFSLVSAIVSIILYHNIELWNSPRFLLMLLPFWFSACGLKLLKVFSLYVTGIEGEHLRLWITWAVVLIYGGLFIIEVVELLMQRYAFFKKPRKIHAPPEMENTRFYANYANFLSKATYWWISDLLVEGYKNPISQEQLGHLPNTESAVENYYCLANAFETERAKAAEKGQQPSLHKVNFRAFWPMLALASLFRLIADMLAFLGPWCIELIVDYAYDVNDQSKVVAQLKNQTHSYSEPSTVDTNLTLNMTSEEDKPIEYYVTVGTFSVNGYGLCIVLFIATLVQHTLLQNHHFLVIRQGIRLRTALQAMVYNKALKLSSLNITMGKTSIGQIVNHMSMDATFLMFQFFFISYVWATPIQIGVALTLMYLKLGISAIIGGILIVLCGPIQIVLGRLMSTQQKKVLHQTDVRVKQCNEMIQGIKVIKLLAWEDYVLKQINATRRKELKCLLKNVLYKSVYSFVAIAIPTLATLLTFVLYPIIEEQPLTAGKALSTLALFNILVMPLALFSMMSSTLITANISAKRLVPYFLFSDAEGLPVSEENMKTMDTMKLRGASVSGDVGAEGENIQLRVLTSEDRDDPINASVCSLVSHVSHGPPGFLSARQSRQNSSSSLLDFGLDHHSNAGFPRRHSAVTLSATSDHHPHHHHHHHHHHQRWRHQGGLSIDELDEEQNSIEITEGSFSWDIESRASTLTNINLQIPSGKLIMIVGSVGSGKSSLLSAMLGEMLTLSGSVHWSKQAGVAYCAQKPWLLNQTLKDNILFGSQFSYKRYNKVIEACALQPDIDTFPAGDLTEIGEKGINLSGGQKQRVSIARALYSSADIIIMDDPLSALDAHVGRHVFDDVIMKKFMRRKKTVILVTHQLQYLNYAHSVIVMKNGEIECQGKMNEVKKTHPELYESWRKALKEAKAAELSHKESTDNLDDTIDKLPSRQISVVSQVSQCSNEDMATKETNGKLSTVNSSPPSIDISLVDEGTDTKDDADLDEDGSKKASIGKLIKTEHKEVGSVSYKVYLSQLSSCGYLFVILTLILSVAYQAFSVSANTWMSQWASKSTVFVKNKAPNSTEVFDDMVYIPTYITLSVCAAVGTLLSRVVLHLTGIRGAKTMHTSLLNTVIKVPMRFFDTNPSGRILNRFSTDICQIDQKIPTCWESYIHCALTTLAAIIVNCIFTPYFILAALPIFVLYVLLQKFFTATARELQRLDSVTKSPIFSHLSETLNGIQTIRAYRVQSRFRSIAVHAIDNNVIPFLFNQTANRWLGIRLDYMGAILVFVSALTSLSSSLSGHTEPAFIGLCLAYALMVSNYMNWIVRQATDLEMNMNAVERVNEFRELETETTQREEKVKESGWPTVGEIVFQHVTLRYDKHQDPVVSDISFTIQPGEKIGICGRTGSGKSSLTLSLFRMIDISEGEILIDGRNISHIPLPELRSKLAIIPQDPTLFTGTVRYNLDPAGVMDDSKIWQALETVQMKDTIESLPDKLDASVSEGGENFSIGQKQLFCLARAFLRENKILVLDEATASIDLETDNKLQTVIGTVFKDKTVITIAHRISTIMNYDRVMTMESGTMMEFDSPTNLMERESYFAQLVKQHNNHQHGT